MTNRRSFLGVLGFGAVAGPQVAKEALSQAGISQGFNALGGVAGKYATRDFDDDDIEDTEESSDDSIEGVNQSKNKSREDRGLKNIKMVINNYNKLIKQRGDYTGLQNYIRNVNNLDIDLASNKSMSPSAKVLMQARRNFDRQFEDRIDYADRNITHTMRRWRKNVSPRKMFEMATVLLSNKKESSFENFVKILNREDDDD